MNELDLFNTEIETITSKEICKLIGRRHKHIRTLIRLMIDKGFIRSTQFELSEYTDSIGRKMPMYKLDKTASIPVVAQQSPELMAEIFDSWHELEIKSLSLSDFNDAVESVRAWTDQAELVQG